MQEKDNVIKSMEQQVQKLMIETKRLSGKQAKEQNRLSPISLSIRMKPSNETENKIGRLTRQNDILKLKVIKYGQAIERIQKEKKALEEEIQLMNDLSLAEKADTSQISALNASIAEKKAYIQELKRSAELIGKKQGRRVEFKLQDLPENSQIYQKQEGDNLNISKETLMDKLKNSTRQIDLLKSQIQSLHVNVRKLTDELKILRKNSSSEGILGKIDAIRGQNEKAIDDLRKKGDITVNEQMFLYRRENDLIQIQILKTENEEMRKKLDVFQVQMDKRHRDSELKMSKIMNKEAEAARERDNYKKQLDEAKASHQKSGISNKITHQNLGETAQELLKQLNAALKAKDNAEKMLASEKAAFGIRRQKYDALVQESRQRGQQIEKLRGFQVSNRSLNQKVNNLNEEIKVFHKKYNQLKGLGKSLETAVQKSKGEQKMQPQLLQKLQQFQKIVMASEKEYRSSQIQALQQEKDGIIEDYYNSIKKEQERIDADEFLQQDQKKQIKLNKQQELSRTKDVKLAQIDTRLTEFNAKKADLQHRSNQAKTVPARLANLQKAIRTGNIKQANVLNQNQELKQSQAKLKESQLIKQSQTKVMGGNGFMSGAQAVQERRQKFYEEFNRINDSNKQKLKNAINENNDLKIKLSSMESAMQRQRMDFIRERKAIEGTVREKQRQMEVTRIQRMNSQALKTKKIQTSEVQIARLRGEKEQLQQCCNQLSMQLTQVSSLNDKNALKVIELTADMERLRGAIDESNKGMDVMMTTLDDVRKGEQQKVAALQMLLQQRSETFVKIEKVKDSQINQLKRLIRQLEERLESETYESIKAKQANTALNQRQTSLTKEKNSIEEGAKLQQVNLKKEIQYYQQKSSMLQDVNQQVQQQLISLAEDFQKLQEEGSLLRIRIDTLQKQKKLYADLEGKIVAVETAKQKEREQMNYLIADKKEQLQRYQNELLLLNERFKLLAQENRKMAQQNVIIQADTQRAKDKLNDKSLELIAIAEQKSLVYIEKAKMEAELQQLIKSNREYEKEIQRLKEQIANFLVQMQIERLNEQSGQSGGSDKNQMKNILQQRLNQQSHVVQVCEVINLTPSPQESKESSPATKKAVSFGKIQAIEQNVMDQIPSQNHEGQEMQANDNMQIQSVHSNRPSTTKIGLTRALSGNDNLPQQQMGTTEMASVSRQKQQRREREDSQSSSSPPQGKMILPSAEEYFKQKQQWKKREAELLLISKALEDERDELTEAMNNMMMQLQELRQSNRHIKIDDTVNNTQQATDQSKEMQNLELLLEESEREKDLMKNQLDQQRQNVQKLLKASEQLQQERDHLVEQLDQARKYCEEYVVENEQMKKEHEQKVEQFIAQIMQKENGLANALRELQQCQQKLDHAQQLINHHQVLMQEKERETAQLQKIIKEIKGQYRKYEEEAQMEILTLKEKFDQLAVIAEQKNEDIQQIAEKYFQLEQVRGKQEERTKKLETELGRITHHLLEIEQDNDKIRAQRIEFNEARKKMSLRVRQLQVDLLNQSQKLSQAGKATTLILTKANIHADGLEQQIADARSRLLQKQRIILSLKNQIALYNDQCSQLKRANDELDYEVQRATKELKDIMISYQKEFEAVGKEKLAILQGTHQYEVILKQKEQKLSQMRSQMRQNERERAKAEFELKETRDQLERYKNVKGRELYEKSTQLQVTKNSLQILKTSHSKMTQENKVLQAQLQEQKQRGKATQEEYRDKMSKYQEQLEQISNQITTLGDRPSKQTWEQALFQNQLFRNRVEELEEQARKKTNGNEDLVTVQFRKYKVRSETVIRNLEQQMESYGSKINQLQEANFYLKRENEALRMQMHRLNESKQDLDEQIRCLQDDVTQLKEEVQFYKGRRKQELTKLLNETDN